VTGWRATAVEDRSTEDLVRDFTRELYEFTATHRGLMLALITAGEPCRSVTSRPTGHGRSPTYIS
jgi:hypothetical protein